MRVREGSTGIQRVSEVSYEHATVEAVERDLCKGPCKGSSKGPELSALQAKPFVRTLCAFPCAPHDKVCKKAFSKCSEDVMCIGAPIMASFRATLLTAIEGNTTET